MAHEKVACIQVALDDRHCRLLRRNCVSGPAVAKPVANALKPQQVQVARNESFVATGEITKTTKETFQFPPVGRVDRRQVRATRRCFRHLLFHEELINKAA